MEYIILEQQQNTYPTISNYSKTSLDSITLTGNFDTNKLNFIIPTLDSLVVIPDTNFRFLLSIDEKVYTSPLYYNELITSYNESNPYFLKSSFLEEFTVKYTPNDIVNLIAQLKVLENTKNINVTKNVFVLSDGSYDYIALIKYIDWLVSAVRLNDLESNGVLSPKELSSYILPEIPIPEVSLGTVATVEVVEENIQAYEWEYIRKKNLDREPLAVRETQNTTSREIYRINEGNKFIGNSLGNGLFEVFDDGRTARVGYIKVSSDFAARRFKRLSGPFNIKILTIKKPTNTLDAPANLTTPSNPVKQTSTGNVGGRDNFNNADIDESTRTQSQR